MYTRVPKDDGSTGGLRRSLSASSLDPLAYGAAAGAGMQRVASHEASAVVAMPGLSRGASARGGSQQGQLGQQEHTQLGHTSLGTQQPDAAQPSAVYARRSALDTLAALGVASPAAGLSNHDVEFRRRRHGRNVLKGDDDEAESVLHKFLEQFKNPMNMLLAASAAVSLLIGEMEDAISITLAMIIVVTVAFVQEYRSEKSLEALNTLLPHYCKVVRNMTTLKILAEDLVPGDIVHFSAGDRIPADLRLLTANDLELDESSLTGETRPRRKNVAAILSDNVPALADRDNIAFMGTLVRNGNCSGVVIGTGRNTEFGHVFTMMKEVETRKTPLQASMDELGKQLSFLSFLVIVVIVLIGVYQGRPMLEMFTIGVSLAVAAIPEGLPIVVTVTLALGVLRMAGRNAIIKKLPSVESLGSVNVICVDKTGTLTMNKMTVTKVFTMSDRNLVDVKSGGGGGGPAFEKMAGTSAFQQMMKVAVLCNNARTELSRESIGQPTEIALLELARKTTATSAHPHMDQRLHYTRVSEIPFTSDRKCMSVTVQPLVHPISPVTSPVQQQQLQQQTLLKGSMESVLDVCTRYFVSEAEGTKPFDGALKELVRAQHDQVANSGLRCMFFAYTDSTSETDTNMVFVGFVGMTDPVRPGTAAAVNRLIGGGVRVVMLTGDSEGTAGAIARETGIPIAHKMQSMMSGMQLDAMEEGGVQGVEDIIDNVNVFYRVTPKHKMMIVRALQAKGYNVAMTGDGVNDAPALKLADIGISMGKSGTDVSKEAADMILVNDEFATILYAIEEGKSIFYNIQNFLRFQLSTSIAALTLVAGATLFGFNNPLNAMQILWINIICDGPVAQSLGVENVDPDIMKKPPRAKGQPIITRPFIYRVCVSAFCIVTGTFYVFRNEIAAESSEARVTTMTFTCFVLFDMFNSLACRSVSRSLFSLGPFSNQMLNIAVGLCLVGQLLVIYVPFFQSIFQTEALSLGDLVYLLGLTSTVLWVDEWRKWIKRRGLGGGGGGKRDAFGKFFNSPEHNV
ncbi:High affinity Ca2+/Mn2+ P-type ATPase-like protein [Podochytrium sp. JEL0797]|nr:High affinity Ca2+/Mn2+ P-type ATPase-like protein [Podochytrium sp. JEL0797]